MAKTTITKMKQVSDYLKKHKQITSWEAIEKFRATRLAAIICNLRKRGWHITSVPMSKLSDGEDVNFVKYVYSPNEK